MRFKIIFTLAILLFLLASCNNSKREAGEKEQVSLSVRLKKIMKLFNKILKSIGILFNDTKRIALHLEEARSFENQKEFELSLKRQKEEELFQNKISEHMRKEQEKLKTKKIEIQRREDLTKLVENRKSEAFTIIDDAHILFNQGEYEQSIEKYYQAELILNEINFPTGVIREMVSKIQEKNREEELNRLKDLELSLKREREEEIFQKQILEKIKFEERKMREKQEKLKKQNELRAFQEQRQEQAFIKLETAQKRIDQGNFDEAIRLYREAADIFKEIQWDEEITIIKNAIIAVEDKKREAELRKQQELQLALEKEKYENTFQEKLIREMRTQREELKKKEIVLREREKELAYREKRKDEAFNLLEKAQDYVSKGKFYEAIEFYHNVANIFAQIQWRDEIPIINKAIQDLEEKKRDQIIVNQKALNKAIEKEKADFTFMEKVRLQREREKIKALEEKELIEKKELITSQNLVKKQQAFTFINSGYSLLHQKNYDEALKNYQNAIKIFTEIGWTSDYSKLLQDTIKKIEIRKEEIEREKQLEIELFKKREKEEQRFQKKITDYMRREQERLKTKQLPADPRE